MQEVMSNNRNNQSQLVDDIWLHKNEALNSQSLNLSANIIFFIKALVYGHGFKLVDPPSKFLFVWLNEFGMNTRKIKK